MSKNVPANKTGRSTRSSQRSAALLSNVSEVTEIERQEPLLGQNEIVLSGAQQVETMIVPERHERGEPLGDITVIH